MVDLDTLAAYLSSDKSPDECMLLSDLDGFLTGVICCPVLIMPSEWLPVALGGKPADVPPAILELVMQRYNEIVAALNSTPPILEPVFWQANEGHVIAMDWCEGFMDAVAVRKTEWDAFIATKQGKRWMQPIVSHLFDEHGVSLSGVSEEELDAHLDRAAKKIPETVPRIFVHWQSKRRKQALH
jgi:uncharacterized protein